LLKRADNAGLSSLFRAGHSLYWLIISTAERHGLELGQPYVAVKLEQDCPVRIEYWNTMAGDILQSHECAQDEDTLLALEPFLTRLWNDTKETSGITPIT
jgi:hypothetical protein